MQANASHQDVRQQINAMSDIVRFVFKHQGRVIDLPNISIDDGGHLSYRNNNNQMQSVSSYMKNIKGTDTERWLNHLLFIDGFSEERNFKKFVSEKYNLIFT